MSRALRLGPLLLGGAFVGLLAWHFGLQDLARALEHLSPAYLSVYLALTGVVLFGYALRWQLVAAPLGGALPLGRLAAARLAGDAVGSLLPSARLAGEPVRAAIVCAGGVEGTAATAGVALDRMLETIANIVCALLYVSVFSLTHTLGGGAGTMTGMAVALLVGLAALGVPISLLALGVRPLWFVYALLGERRPPWLEAVRRTEAHVLRVFREQPRTLLLGLLLSLAVEAVVVGQYHFLLAAFDLRVDLPTLLLVLVGTGMARAVPAPAALGSLEGGQVAVFTLAEGAPALGFVAGLVIRLHETLLLVAGLIALSAHGMSLARLPAFRPSEEAPT